jgi:RNA-binding protein
MSGGRGHDEKKLPELQDLKPTVWIGKQGCTEATLHEIRDQVKKRKMIKVKWLRSTEPDPESIAEATGTRLVQVRGRTIVLAGRKTAGK